MNCELLLEKSDVIVYNCLCKSRHMQLDINSDLVARQGTLKFMNCESIFS